MAPLEWRLSFLRRGPAKAALAKVLAWGPVHVIIAHGTWARQEGQAFIRRSFRWLAR